MDPHQDLQKTIELLLYKIKNTPTVDLDMVDRAIAFGKNAHSGQYRKRGDLFFIHPVRVAIQAIDYNLDTETIVASLLHDVIEDTETKPEEIGAIFGETVEGLVQALTKVRESKKLTLKKIFSLGNLDFRVILIKLLDRLDNLSDLQFLSRQKQRMICQETATIYTEVANGLGLAEIEETMRDRVFQNLYPASYKKTTKKLDQLYEERHLAIQRIVQTVQSCIPVNLLHRLSPQYVKAHQFLYNRREILKVLDSIVIETADTISCYRVLGEIHTKLRCIPLSIRDFISNPRANGWRGLRTKLMVHGEQIPVFIVTKEFQRKNRRGVITLINEGIYQSENYKQFLKIYLDVASDSSRIEDVFRLNKTRTIQTLTPKGRLIELRYGATILDFAFMIHTDLGFKCSGGIINGSRYPRDKILEDGMVVNVLKSDSVKPEASWLECVVMPKSRREIIKATQK